MAKYNSEQVDEAVKVRGDNRLDRGAGDLVYSHPSYGMIKVVRGIK